MPQGRRHFGEKEKLVILLYTTKGRVVPILCCNPLTNCQFEICMNLVILYFSHSKLPYNWPELLQTFAFLFLLYFLFKEVITRVGLSIKFLGWLSNAILNGSIHNTFGVLSIVTPFTDQNNTFGQPSRGL